MAHQRVRTSQRSKIGGVKGQQREWDQTRSLLELNAREVKGAQRDNPLTKVRGGSEVISLYKFNMEVKNFRKLISLIQQQPGFLTSLAELENTYLVKIYKITELDTRAIIDLYTTMQRKFYLNRRTSNEEAWYENELRIFVWLLLAYLYVFGKNLQNLNDEDWKFFSPIFNFKSTIFFEFQSRSLLRSSGRPTIWTEEQTELLETIIKQKDTKNHWNAIARDLFVQSGKRFFRNPKQCRERWMNHLDPSKLHSEWTIEEDLTLLNCIKKKGKRWSVAMKELANTRTEHMVKNRYKSLISNEAKKYPGKRDFEIENILIKKLNKAADKQSKEFKETKEVISKKNKEQQKIEVKVERNDNFVPFFENIGQKNQFKNPMVQSKSPKLNFIRQEDSFHLIELKDENFNGFEANSPMFIPWQDKIIPPFDLPNNEDARQQLPKPVIKSQRIISLSDSDELHI